jgi:glycosyltransferase involved in cell wall biosynthesis
VESIAPLAEASQRKVHLLGLNATLDAQSAATVAQYQAHARTLGVDQQITWINDYRPIEECIQLLEMADYVIYPYKHTRESASAAVTIGLATLKPVLVSPLPIFSDLADCTWRMAGESAQDIVEAVCTLERSPEYAQQLHAAQQTWLAERNWSRISARLDAITGGLLLDRRLEAAISDSRKAAFAARETPVSPVARLLVDVSALFFDEAETAIQRVVRGILGGLLASPPAGFSICPIYGTPDQAYRHTNRYSPAIEPGDEADHERPVKARAGDIFLGLDLSTPLFPRAEAALRDFRLAGARIHFVVCDMTPLRYPHYAPPARCHAVETGMRALARQADSLLCVSATVVTEVRIWLSQHTEDSPLLKVRHFHPGADSAYLASSPSLPAEASSLLAQIRSAPAFLLVGTLEPRMGQAQALAAFEALWRDEMPVNLVMIGKAGEMGDDFPVKIRAHPALGRRLFWLEESTDAFLEQIYAAGTCLIVACEAEGFALPLIEAARQHLPIIARDIPVLREVAGEHAHYFSGPQPEVLATTIRTWLTMNQAGLAPQSSAMPWQTWQQSTQQILDIILND